VVLSFWNSTRKRKNPGLPDENLPEKQKAAPGYFPVRLDMSDSFALKFTGGKPITYRALSRSFSSIGWE
jgi:hypothetical protein